MSGNSNRAQPRQSMRFPVRSRLLPGYRAITMDISQSGVQLETEAQMESGLELELEFEFDREDVRDLSCPARVIWSRPDGGRRARFRTGLAFLPSSDEQRTSLARMATVLQARSDSDIESLLEEAKKLDPERAETFARVQAQSKTVTAAAPATSLRVLPLLGVYIPLRVVLEGYHWDRPSGTLTVTFSDHQQEHKLYFPGARLLTDYGCLNGPTIAALFCTPHSDTIKKLPKPAPEAGWKHYRFLQADGQPVLELVSAPCQSAPVAARL